MMHTTAAMNSRDQPATDQTFTRLVTHEISRHVYAMRLMSRGSYSALKHCEEIAHHDRMMQYASALVADWAKMHPVVPGVAALETADLIKMRRAIETDSKSLDNIRRQLFHTRRCKTDADKLCATDADQRDALLPAIVAAAQRIFAHKQAGDCDVNPCESK